LFKLGYLVENLSFNSFVHYWFMNLGISILILPIGFLFADKPQRKFFIPFLIFFILGNIFQLSSEIAANHKFFNLFLIGVSFFVGLTIKKLTSFNYGKWLIIPFLLIFLTLTGIIDFFPVVNDRKLVLKDYSTDPIVRFIKDYTPKDSVFLNSSFLYNPASLAGRKIFMGWPYFAWSAGYDTNSRGKVMEAMYKPNSKTGVCKQLLENSIQYVSTRDTTNDKDFPYIDYAFFKTHFDEVYHDEMSGLIIFEVKTSCI